MATPVVFVYTTFPSQNVAQDITHTLLGERLIACANIFGPMTSVYRWDGQEHSETEVPCYLKTSSTKLSALHERFLEIHPYECPCFVELKTEFVTPAFAQWIERETVE